MVVKNSVNKVSGNIEAEIRDVFLKVTNDLEKVRSGETVLIKPALNSSNPYPATTHPLAVKVVAEELLKKGANVVVGDQSGIGNVIHTSEGVQKGSSMENFKVSGIYEACKELDIKFIAFEQEGWEEGFVHVQPNLAKSWPDGFFVTKWVKDADHIINLPRVSTHAMAGVTLGFKNWVGILREDSRGDFHVQGTFKVPAKMMFRNLGFEARNQADEPENANTDVDIFWRMMTEISLAVKEKLLTTLFVATKAQTTMGPDAGSGMLKSYVVEPAEGIVFASNNPLEAEIEALKLLKELYIHETPSNKKLIAKLVSTVNAKTPTLDKVDIEENAFIKHARKIGY